MNNFKLPVILIGVLFFSGALGFGFAYSQDNSRWLEGKGAGGEYSDLFAEFESIKDDISDELEGMMPGYRKLSQEKQELKEKYMELFKKFEAIKEDRRNLLAQVRNLLPVKNRIKELQNSLDKIRVNLELMGKEKDDALSYNIALKSENDELKKMLAQRVQGLKDENEKLKISNSKIIMGLRDEVREFKSSQAELVKERNRFKAAYKDLSDGTAIKELEKKITRTKKEKKDLIALLKKKESESKQLKAARDRSKERVEELNMGLRENKKKYAKAIEKNKLLEEEARVLPAKFTEIVRQNRVLVRETARMHYNLGVFYTRNKEYERALEEFKKTADMTPDDAYVHFNLGFLYSEHLVNRKKAINHFRSFLRLVKGEDKDVDWVKKYLLTWETYEGQRAFH